MELQEEKIKLAKELLKKNKNKRTKYSIIFNLLKKEIKEMIKEDINITTIAQILSVKLNEEINASTLRNWIKRNINIKKEGENVKDNKLNKKEKNQPNNDDVIDSFFAKAKKLTK